MNSIYIPYESHSLHGSHHEIESAFDGLNVFFLLSTLGYTLYKKNKSDLVYMTLLFWFLSQLFLTLFYIHISPLYYNYCNYVFMHLLLLDAIRCIREKIALFWVLGLSVLSVYFFTLPYRNQIIYFIIIISSLCSKKLYLVSVSFCLLISSMLSLYMINHPSMITPVVYKFMSNLCIFFAISCYKLHITSRIIPNAQPIAVPSAPLPDEELGGPLIHYD